MLRETAFLRYWRSLSTFSRSTNTPEPTLSAAYRAWVVPHAGLATIERALTADLEEV